MTRIILTNLIIANILLTVAAAGQNNKEMSSLISDTDACIPPAVVLPVEMSYTPNEKGELRYVPSQPFAPFPERLIKSIASLTSGMEQFGKDSQTPLEDGIEFDNNRRSSFELSHRRAGVFCSNVPWARLRINNHCLAEVHFAIREGDKIWPMENFSQTGCVLKAGRMVYSLEDENAGIKIDMVIIMPVAPTAYGFISQIHLSNITEQNRKLELVAIIKRLARDFSNYDRLAPRKWDREIAAIETKKGTLDFSTPKSSEGYAYDPNYTVLCGFNNNCEWGNAENDETGICKTKLEVPGKSDKTCYFAAIIDSPGYDRINEEKRVSDFFNRNENLPPQIRKNMTAQYLETLNEIVVNGNILFKKILKAPEAAFNKSVESWDKGVYRQQPVRFEMTDKKLQSFANFIANDLFQGLIQPPGIVHNAQHGDTWGFIFAYRHIHAACDLGFEPYAIGYMRMLSANQNKQTGRINSMNPKLGPGHPTELDESYIDSLWQYYKWTGDLKSVMQLWPTLKLAVNYLDKNLDPDGDGLYCDTLHQWKSDFDNRGPSSAFQSALVWKALKNMTEFAELVGDTNSVKYYQEKADKTYRAFQWQLWSDEFAVAGSKCPLGILRLHPQSLDIEIPIWTGLLDKFQGQAMLDWSSANLEFTDKSGGRWLYDNDFWPAVWSQHVPAESDEMMVGWAQMLGGRNDIGNNIIRSIAAGSYRSDGPGVGYLFWPSGSTGGDDPATAQGAFTRALVEGTFGVKPAIDKKQITISPHFPSDWDHASFKRPGLEVVWQKQGNKQTLSLKTNSNIEGIVELRIDKPFEQVTVNEKPASIDVQSDMYWTIVRVKTPKGGGVVTVTTKGTPAKFDVPENASVGQPVEIKIEGVEKFEPIDRFKMIKVAGISDNSITVIPDRQGTGRCVFFLDCQNDNIRWIQPIAIGVGPKRAVDVVKQTVNEPVSKTQKFTPVDLSASYTDDIQTWMCRTWQWDYEYGRRAVGEPWYCKSNTVPDDKKKERMGYWTMPPWTPSEDLPTKISVSDVPFLIGPMGPGEKSKASDLIMLANTAPYSSATSAKIGIGKRLSKFYLLSFNMNLPQKCYETAVEILIKYDDGTVQKNILAAPLNFDCFYQDFGINTVALNLPFSQDPKRKWPDYFGYDMADLHLTMTDIICNDSKVIESIKFKSVATETFFGLAGLTLVEASNIN